MAARTTPSPFAARRGRLSKALRGSAAIFAGGHEVLRNGDVHYEFRQSSTFYYLTGFEEPEAVAVLRPGHAEPFVLFVRPRDPSMEVWLGPRAGVEGAVRDYGADAAYSIEELDERLPQLLVEADSVHFSLGSDERIERILSAAVGRRRSAPNALGRIVDPAPLVAQLRLIKSPEEVRALQHAIDATGAGIEAAMRATQAGMFEYEAQAALEAEFRRRGSPRQGFSSIVASGPNACTLHHESNRRRIERGDLLLLDVGAEVDMYSADVSRTYPVSGRFSAGQRAVYDVVLEAQQAGIDATRPGATFMDVHDAALTVIVRGLRSLGVLKGRVDTLRRRGAYRPYFMHATSHWLGLDVHDVGAYRDGERSVELRPGMVLTVEPGIYLAPDSDAPRALRGIGVRIEDDVLVTHDGHRNLSQAIPRDPAVLEAMAGAAVETAGAGVGVGVGVRASASARGPRRRGA